MSLCLVLQHHDQPGTAFYVNFLALEKCYGHRFSGYTSTQLGPSQTDFLVIVPCWSTNVFLVHSLPVGVFPQGPCLLSSQLRRGLSSNSHLAWAAGLLALCVC